MKENKAMAQEIWKISILYSKTSKESYHHITFRKIIMSRRCSIKKLFLIILQYSQKNACVGVSFLIKTKAFKPETLSKRDSFISVFLWIWRLFKEHLFWRTFVNGFFWEFFLLCQFECFPTWHKLHRRRKRCFLKNNTKQKNILKLI